MLMPIGTEEISFEDYLRLYDSYEGGKTEWAEGEVYIYQMTNNPQHQRIIVFLTTLLEYYLEVHDLGVIVPSNVPMKIDEKNAPEPDLMVLLKANQARLQERHVEGSADIVVEVVSPESDERDYGRKRLIYEAAGVPEYWLIDPLRKNIVIHTLRDKLYRNRPTDDAGRITSPLLPGFALDVEVFWRIKLPNAREIVALVEGM